MARLGIRETIKRIMAHGPMDTILPVVDGRMEVKITGKELLSEINSNLPSQDIMEYLLSVSTYTDPQVRMRIVLDDEVDLEETRKIYTSYAFLMARKNSKELRAYTFKIISFILFGALVLTLSYFMENTMKRVIADSVNIIGSGKQLTYSFLLDRIRRRSLFQSSSFWTQNGSNVIFPELFESLPHEKNLSSLLQYSSTLRRNLLAASSFFR